MKQEKCKTRGPLRFLVLWIVAKNPSTSKQIMTDLAKRKGRTLSVGTVYPVIKQHREEGFIELKGRSTYHITSLGKKELKKIWKHISQIFYDYDEIKQKFKRK